MKAYQITSMQNDLYHKFLLLQNLSASDSNYQKFLAESPIQMILQFRDSETKKKFEEENPKLILPLANSPSLGDLSFFIVNIPYKKCEEIAQKYEFENILLDLPLFLCSEGQSSPPISKNYGKLIKFPNYLPLPSPPPFTIHLFDMGMEEPGEMNHSTILVNLITEELGYSMQGSDPPKIPAIVPFIRPYKTFNSQGQAFLSDLLAQLHIACEWIKQQKSTSEEKNCGKRHILLVPASSAYIPGYESLFRKILDDIAKEKMIFIGAAGNLGPDTNQLGYPACLRGCIAVGSINSKGDIMFHSSRSLSMPELKKPEYYEIGSIPAQPPNRSKDKIERDRQIIIGTSVSATIFALKVAILTIFFPTLSVNQLQERICSSQIPTEIDSSNLHPSVNLVKILEDAGWIKDIQGPFYKSILQAVGYASVLVVLLIVAIILI